jgi:hypothetical protein
MDAAAGERRRDLAPGRRALADPTRQAGRRGQVGLEEWQGLDVRLRLLLGTEALRETMALAAEASALAAAGLEALGFLEQGVPAPESWWTARAPLLEREQKPRTGLEVAYRPSITRLTEAAAGK